MEYITENFANIHELIRANETRPCNSVFAGRSLSSEDGDRSFTKTSSYAEAVKLLKNGYTEPLDKIKRGVEANLKTNTTQKTAVKNDIVGYAPCVPNAILGIPQAMINKDTIAKKSKIITIVYDTHVSCGVSTEAFIKAGVATLSIINSLEANGYRVALKVAFFNGSVRTQKLFATVNLKDWRQPLDLKKITFPFCHPSMLRRIGFKYLETQPKINDNGFYYGYSRPDASINTYEEMASQLRENHLITDKEKYINIKLCKENEYNPQKIAKACGLE